LGGDGANGGSVCAVEACLVARATVPAGASTSRCQQLLQLIVISNSSW
jgi:hypothetical protein